MIVSGTTILKNPPAQAHIVYPYMDHLGLIEAVTMFAESGITQGESVVLISSHCGELESSLADQGFDVTGLKASDRLICEDAGRALAGIMVGLRPDPGSFHSSVDGLIQRARAPQPDRPVRIFGTMVDLLWRDNCAAALELENLWNEILKTHRIALLCAYRFSGDRTSLPEDLEAAHNHCIV